MARKLPIGVQDFEKLRRGGFAYIDKTAYVYELARAGVPSFLSRPRRFGKSLLISTMKAYFEGKRELFEGLDIERLEGSGPGSWQARPVFHLDLNGSDYTRAGGLEERLDSLLRGLEGAWGGGFADLGFGSRFQKLLEQAHASSGRRVAVLVDEYDKPLLESMGDPVLEERNRATLKAFYSALKSADAHLHFVFLSGVTKFSKVSIFSDLNQLRDISLDGRFAGICGVSEPELLGSLGPELGRLAERRGLERDECLRALRAQYDGYCFHPDGPGGPVDRVSRCVYNPFSLLNALDEQRLGSYWFATGTPTFLARQIRESGLVPSRLVDGTIYATERRLSDYRADDPDPIPLLYQTGYLTIRANNAATGEYELSIPNQEVEYGLVESLLPDWAPGYSAARGTDVFTLRRYLETGDTQGIRRVFEALFASIPYTRGTDPFGNYFQAVIWLVFTLLGRYVAVEMHTASGRVDCVVETRAHVYVFEFKRDGTAEAALAQIAERGYALPFAADVRPLHLVGCAFDPETRLMSDWLARE